MAAGSGPERQRNHLDELPRTHTHILPCSPVSRARTLCSGVAETREERGKEKKR